MAKFPPKTGVTLGTKKGSDFVLPYDDRATHLHVIGASGQGKTKLLEHMIREDIVNRQGVCVLDPHGVLYDNLVRWLAVNPLMASRRKIHLIDPSSEFGQVGFNPFAPTPYTTTEGRVDAFATALSHIYGQGDLTATPLIKERLELIGHALDVNGLTPLEAMKLATVAREPVREYLTSNIENPVYRDYWAEVNRYPDRFFMESMAPITRRFLGLLGSPAMQHIFGQSSCSINWRRCMDEGEIVLVRLVPTGGDFTSENARALGTLIFRYLYMTALGRKADTSRPFYLYVDEAYEFLTDDIEEILVGTRKFGLHLVLAHHYLQQLRRRGDSIFDGVMSGAQTKVVFGLGYDDGLELVNWLFPDRIDPNRIKHVLDRPVAVGHERKRTRHASHSDSYAETHTPDTETMGESDHYDKDGLEAGRIEHRSLSQPTGPVMTWSHSDMEGWQEVLATKYKPMASATYHLEDIRHQEATGLMRQEMRQAVVKTRTGRAQFVTTPEVSSSYARSPRVDTFVQRAIEASDFAAPPGAISEEINHREMRLLREVKQYLSADDEEAPAKLPKWG